MNSLRMKKKIKYNQFNFKLIQSLKNHLKGLEKMIESLIKEKNNLKKTYMKLLSNDENTEDLKK